MSSSDEETRRNAAVEALRTLAQAVGAGAPAEDLLARARAAAAALPELEARALGGQLALLEKVVSHQSRAGRSRLG